MSTENKTQLQTNNTALASLTDRVLAAKDTAAALPDAGSGGGASVETCTVTINSTIRPNTVIYLSQPGQEIQWMPDMPFDVPAPFTSLCGSFLFIYSTNISVIDGAKVIFYTSASNSSTMYYYLVLITASAGENVTIG